MKLINVCFALLSVAALPALAQAVPAPLPDVRSPQAQPVAALLDCNVKGCPKLDQDGKAPLRCTYNSSMATGWQCILICAYPQTTWGTKVDAANCD